MISINKKPTWGILFLMLVLPFLSQGQQQRDAEIDFLSNEYNISIKKGTLHITSDYADMKSYNTDAANYFPDENIYHDSFRKIDNIKAYFYLNENGKLKKHKIKNFTETSSPASWVFYDDSKQTRINFPKRIAGSKTSVSYTTEYSTAFIPIMHYFTDFLPIKENTFRIEFDNNVKLSYFVANDPESKLKLVEEKKGNTTIWEWKLDNMDSFQRSHRQLSIRHTEPHVIVNIEYYIHDGDTIDVFNGVQGLAKYYYGFVDSLNTDPLQELDTFTHDLIKECNNDIEKMNAIYYWVQTNIKYIAFEDGYNGFIPASAKETFDKRHGDCKGMSSILSYMLQSVGLNAKLTWVGTRDIPYSYSDIPNTIVDNHMIVTCYIDDQSYILDATNKYLTSDMPPSSIQNKEYLVINKDLSYEINTAPIIDISKNYFTDTTEIWFSGDSLIGHTKSYSQGYVKQASFYYFEKKDLKHIKKGLNKIYKKGNNRFSIHDFKVDSLQIEEEHLFEYDFVIPAYTKTINKSIYFNPHLDKEYNDSRLDMDLLSHGKTYPFKYKESHIILYHIPEGYAVNSIPENINFSNDIYEFASEYKLEEKMLKVSYNFKFKEIEIPYEQLSLHNDFIDQITNSFKKSIELTPDNHEK